MTELPPAGAWAEDLLDGLNPPQRAAVEYRGPALLVVAGAGSGKTRVLTHRIAGLIRSREAWPSQILAITFTNKAAREMRERVEQLLGGVADGMWISTFHSACVRILRREAERFGFVSSFTIYDSADSRALLKRIIKDREADAYGLTPGGVAAVISKAKNELMDAESFARNANSADPRQALTAEIFSEYSRELNRAHAMDFDDLIAQTVHLFRAFPEVAAVYQRRFRHILVDEYQDTNHAQYALIRELTRPVEPEALARAGIEPRAGETDAQGRIPPASLTVVGDSDQSIYAFRGADIRNIVEFERDFPGASVVLLEQNYRSTQNILSAANAVIENNFDRPQKKLWTAVAGGELITGYTGYSQHDEAQFVADEIERLHGEGFDYRDIAVFYRTNAQTRALEEIFIRSAVPYRVLGGTKFYERAEVKDVLAYLIAVANPFDEYSLRRILNTPKRGIGPATEAQLAAYAAGEGISLREALRHAARLGLGAKLTAGIGGLSALLDEASELAFGKQLPSGGAVPPRPPVEVLQHLLEGSDYLAQLRASRDPQDEARAENVEELVSVARDFGRANPEGTLVDFLTEVSLVAAADELDDESGSVALMTLHTAKGLEFRAVFLTGLEEGLLPHQMSAGEPGGLAEERRLFYVGITRARERLYLTLAMTRAQYGDVDVALPSRFLQEIPAELIAWRQSPAEANGRGGTSSRALNASSRQLGRSAGFARSAVSGGPGGGGSVAFRPEAEPASGGMRDSLQRFREARAGGASWPNTVGSGIRDNGELELAAGDRVRHEDYGEGRVAAVTGVGSKRIAHVDFDGVGRKKLLVKIAPISRI